MESYAGGAGGGGRPGDFTKRAVKTCLCNNYCEMQLGEVAHHQVMCTRFEDTVSWLET